MNKRITASVVAGALATALLGIATLAAPAQAKDSAWNPVSSKDTPKHRIIGAANYRIIG